MHQTFAINLAEAREKESTAESEYQTLKTAKENQLSSTQGALSKMEAENGAAGLSNQEAQDEVDALKKQVKDDTKFIGQTEKSLADKKSSWKVRSDLRAGELEAISKAIYILHNDDARDLFKKSFASQESFLQVSQSSRMATAQSAMNAIKDAAKRSGDNRLLALVSAPNDTKSVKVMF